MNKLELGLAKRLVKLALQEDLGKGDITTRSTIPKGTSAKGIIRVKANGLIAGLSVAELAFKLLKGRGKVEFKARVRDGAKVASGDVIAEVCGDARAILAGERTALNFLGHLSGIATMTRRFVDAVGGRVRIFDTRKTTPGLRYLEKYAVRCGGGQNHRLGLYDRVLIKDNHIKLQGSGIRVQGSEEGKIQRAVALARAKAPKGMSIEVETRNLEQVEEAVMAGTDIIMLDNMDLETIKKAVKLVHSSSLDPEGSRDPEGQFTVPKIEVSGGITLNNVEAISRTGVDIISVGQLTHSAPALDIGLDIGG